MTDIIQGFALLSGVLVAAGGLALIAGVAALSREDDTSPWQPGELTTAPVATLPLPAGRHRCPATLPLWQQIARPRAYVARHCEEEIPPSIRVPALLMDPVRRARELRRQLGSGRPALDLRTRAHLAPTAWAARLGRPVQLGMGRAIGGVA